MIADLFWSKVNKSNKCWTWNKSLNRDGYGSINIKGKFWLAHRYSMFLEGHDIENKIVCHKCDNPACVRPDHLFIGTQADNVKDMHNKKRYRTNDTKLSKEDVNYIRTSGLSLSKLSKKFSISTCYASNIRQGIANPGAWKEKI